jgi:hypothetical protein
MLEAKRLVFGVECFQPFKRIELIKRFKPAKRLSADVGVFTNHQSELCL